MHSFWIRANAVLFFGAWISRAEVVEESWKGRVDDDDGPNGETMRRSKAGRRIRNGVVLFDAIITEKDMGRISGQDFIKYPLEDSVDDLRDVSITLRLGYDVHPLFGPLSLHGTGRKLIPELPKHKITYNYSFPTVYT
ncbi:Signal peptidase complex subunit 3 [Hondaea fermentalgiana]|uniref:Signal peptidase complex subunit 3 n=1 Tax=Hondaea fermentalgiana TaxID=2315210 RepID=A0A2R5GXK1_9STRA|nr:Signal peptidase complex subunit 3 [Hondaea fermentalgiana]|eukprot:GBG33141.1 Signal peptidase complex subunit 3 [Hondaea fermentalgiana]